MGKVYLDVLKQNFYKLTFARLSAQMCESVIITIVLPLLFDGSWYMNRRNCANIGGSGPPGPRMRPMKRLFTCKSLLLLLCKNYECFLSLQ